MTTAIEISLEVKHIDKGKILVRVSWLYVLVFHNWPNKFTKNDLENPDANRYSGRTDKLQIEFCLEIFHVSGYF